MASRTLRVRAVVGNNLSLLVGVFTVLALVGGYVTYGTHVDPGVEVQTEEVSRWSSQGGFTHNATVVNGTDVFEAGDVLHERNAYFQRIAPVLNGSAVYSYGATDGGDLRVEGSLTLVLRSVSETEDGNVSEYWRVEEPLGTTTAASVAPGERVRIPFSVNVSATATRVAAIEEQLGGTPGQTEILLRSRFDLAGTRNGQQVDRTRVYEATISTDGNVYSVTGDGPTTDSGRATEEVTVPATYGPLRTVGGPLLSALGLLGLAGLGVARWRGATDLSESEREWLDYRAAREEFDDWITAARVPDDVLPETRATVETLSGLVDVAIDCDRRVIHDRERGEYLVTVDDVVYAYEAPNEPAVRSKPDPLETGEGAGTESAVIRSLFGDGDETATQSSAEPGEEDVESEE